jgi:hypothetical protein
VLDKAERLDKHRFLVQTKVIEDEDYHKIVAIPAAQRTEEVGKFTTPQF